jgi:hypothetical protein
VGTSDLDRLRLRREVGEFRRRETRRVFDPAVYVGRLGGARDAFVLRAQDLPVLDAGLRSDVVAGLLDGADPDWTTAWLARPGTPEPHDLDGAWLAAARAGFAAHGRTLAAFYVLTRCGWRDAVTGETRTWVRLRL